MQSIKLRPYSQLPNILKVAALARWSGTVMGDGWLYRTGIDEQLVGRVPDTSSRSVAEIIDPLRILEL